mgnify:CR=1 FL=1
MTMQRHNNTQLTNRENQMKTTINKIKSLKPCLSGYQNLLDQLGAGFGEDREFKVSSLVGGENSISDITWLLGKTKNKRALVEFAVFSAELVLPIYEKINDSKAPREAIALVRKWLNNESSVTKKELRAAAYAAADAAAYADAAAAAYAAAYASADAAAADAAAAANAAAAADADIKKQINDKLIEIINSIED